MRYLKIILMLIFFFTINSCSEEKLEVGEEFGSVTGKVVSGETFLPLENVKIVSSPSSSTVFTDAEGKFTISNLKVGEYSLQAIKDDFVSKYEAVSISKNNNSEVVFELNKNTTNNTAPGVPALLTPSDNAVNQGVSVKLTWEAIDKDKDDILSYEITLRNNLNNNVIVLSNIKEKEFTVENLLYGAKYFWQVAVSDGIHPAALSSVFAFSTISFPNARYLMVKKVNSNNVIYTADEALNMYQLTSNENNSWRPRKNTESGKIAYIRSSGAQNHIFVMNADGSNSMQVTKSVPIAGFNSDYLGFSWNTSGNKLIYPNFDKLYEIGSDGSGLRKIFQTPNGKFISECDWSNDGSKIALKVNDSNGYNVEIYVINTSGVVLTQIVSGEKGAMGSLDFSIADKKILYTKDVSGYENPMYRQLDSRVFEYNFATAKSTEIDTKKPLGTNDLDVCYSPNGAYLILVNTSNDGVSSKNIEKVIIGEKNSRENLFLESMMPDWQ